jgi:hypothetical protein
MTLNDFINNMQKLHPELKALPVVIIAPNGLELTPKIKQMFKQNENRLCGDKPEKMVICHD